MKTASTLLLAALAGSLLSASASAEWFNDRNGNFIVEAPQGSSKAPQVSEPEHGSFNSRTEDFVAVAPQGSNMPRKSAPAEPEGFIQRSDFVDELHGPWAGEKGWNN